MIINTMKIKSISCDYENFEFSKIETSDNLHLMLIILIIYWSNAFKNFKYEGATIPIAHFAEKLHNDFGFWAKFDDVTNL